ncbi:MAG: hypothetical protein ACJ71N_03050 [Terriglobales bacterium]|jgi:hypothetical protein
MSVFRTMAVFILGAALFLVPSLSASEKPHALAKGAWGGDHVTMNVTESGAQLEFDCAAGEISEPVRVDATGNFDARGKYAGEHPGPTRDEDTSTPVRYHGQIDHNSMELTIMAGRETVGTFTLTRGRETILRKCR